MELEVLPLGETEDPAPQGEQHPLADDDGLAHVSEGEGAADERTSDVQRCSLQRGDAVALHQGGDAVVDAPGDDRGPRHHGELRHDHHQRHERELPLDRGDQLPEQPEGALAGRLRLRGREVPLLFVLT